jgi:hypothetical protein
MSHEPGSYCAEALVRVGLTHQAVVRALVTELDLTRDEADAAWRQAAHRYDEYASIRRAMRSVTRHGSP